MTANTINAYYLTMNKDRALFVSLRENRIIVSSRIVLLVLLNDGRFGMPNSEVMALTGISPAMMSQTVRELENEDLVERQQPIRDKRVTKLYLTDAGNALATIVDKNINALAGLMPRRKKCAG